ncbi:MAG: class I tRNA ligase family protein [Anaeroplasmataceae bacterium]|nr:class I tRNA ligase family protein [Anaeroplasmataceae bacterium]
MKKSISYWIEEWQDSKIFSVENDRIKRKKYYFSYFPKTKHSGFQSGNIRPILVGDVFARYERICDNNVLFPTGLDSLGAEAHEEVKKYKNNELQEIFKNQLLELGIGMDEQKEIYLAEDNYIQNLQRAFIELYEKGYIKYDFIRVCYDKKKKRILDSYYKDLKYDMMPMKCFYLDIKEIQEDIKSKIEKLHVSDDIRKKLLDMLEPKQSITLDFAVTNGAKLPVSFTEPEYMGGISFILIHPDYIDFSKYVMADEYVAIEHYLSDDNDNDFGVFTGTYAINPLTGKKIPIFISILYECPVYIANPFLNERDRKMALEECLPFTDVVQNGVFIESDFLNGVLEEEGRNLLITNFVGAEIAEVRSYFSKDKILLSSLDVYGALVPYLIDEDNHLYSLKDKLPFTLASKFRMVYGPNNITVNKVEGSLNATFYRGMLPILALLYDEIGDSVSIFSKEAQEQLAEWSGIELYTTSKEDLFNSVFFPICILTLLEKEKETVLPPLFRNLLLTGRTVDEAYRPMNRLYNNYFEIHSYLEKELGDALRLYFLSKPLDSEFCFKEEELISLSHLIEGIEELFSKPFVKENQLKEVFQSKLKELEELIENKKIVEYTTTLLQFYKTDLWKADLTLKQALQFLKLLYPIMPFLTEDIYHDVFKGKYLLSDSGWVW